MMKTLIYSCPFVPGEWVAAHGMRPRRILPRRRTPSIGVASGVCPYAHAFVNEVLSERDAVAVVITTVCDQMRRASDVIAQDCNLPVFLMNVPSTWQTAAAQKLYIAELERLGEFMLRLGGKSPSNDDLRNVMSEYDRARSRLRTARRHLSPRRFSEAIAEFYRDGNSDFNIGDSIVSRYGVRLALVGGPLPRSDFDIFDVVEDAGGCIVLDATDNGERTMAAPFERRRFQSEPLIELANVYFGTIPHPFRRPNSELYEWLKRELSERAVQGIILRRYVWCDIWHAEVQRLKEWTDLPVLDIDVTDDESTGTRTSVRVQAFLDMLKA